MSIILKNSLLFQGVADEELSEVTKKVRIKSFRKNETILHEDEANSHMYIIISGMVKVIQITEDGREVVIAIHKTGDSFGEISMIDGIAAYATVIAMGDTTVGLMHKEDFLNMLRLNPKVFENVLKIVCAKFRQTLYPVKISNVKSSLGKVKTLLDWIASDHGRTNSDGVSIDFRLTHQIIANMTGLSRETVTRGMDKLKSDHQIVLDGNRICLTRV
ncbi:MAG TPA: Crp/Fnr family transcriptional regulator [Dissulfurispiraceae bacterium]|nr:Crp/Fnr family transcriptional regulator [Dissulfurispiraceae bacterium]